MYYFGSPRRRRHTEHLEWRMPRGLAYSRHLRSRSPGSTPSHRLGRARRTSPSTRGPRRHSRSGHVRPLSTRRRSPWLSVAPNKDDEVVASSSWTSSMVCWPSMPPLTAPRASMVVACSSGCPFGSRRENGGSSSLCLPAGCPSASGGGQVGRESLWRYLLSCLLGAAPAAVRARVRGCDDAGVSWTRSRRASASHLAS